MVAKKKNTLRQRSAAAASKKSQNPLDNVVNMNMDMGEDPKAFLHQYKESKKDKNLGRQQMFLDQIKHKNGGNPEFAGISKSAIRRRKRKIRDDLKPKMGELLTSLDQEEDLKKEGEVEEVEPQRKRKNEPNIRNQKGAKALSVQESERMKQVLSNSSFQQNTFGALRDVIKLQNR